MIRLWSNRLWEDRLCLARLCGPGSGRTGSEASGSVILARALQESLVYDQYDRVIREQQRALNPSTNGDTSDVAEEDLSKSVTKEKAD